MWLLKFLTLRMSLYVMVVFSIIIVNLGLYIHDKYNEKKILEHFITSQVDYFFNIINEDLDNIINGKNPKYIKLLKNYELTDRDREYYNGFIEFVYTKNDKKIVIDLLSAIQFLETLGKDIFGYCMYVNNNILTCSNPNEDYKFSFNKSISRAPSS